MLYALNCILMVSASGGIAYQDFKTRWISVWLIVVFSIINITFYLVLNSVDQFMENIVFCICYFLLMFLCLTLFYYLKTKKITKIIDRKIGLADVLLFIAVGITIEPENLIYFFTIYFVLAIFIQMAFLRKYKKIPLAGILVLFYPIYLLFLKSYTLWEEC